MQGRTWSDAGLWAEGHKGSHQGEEAYVCGRQQSAASSSGVRTVDADSFRPGADIADRGSLPPFMNRFRIDPVTF